MTRKEFIAGASAAVAGLTSPTLAATKQDPIRAMLLKGSDFFDARKTDALKAKCNEDGFNTLVVDIQDGIVYPSHPEIATKSSLPTAKVAAVVAEWRKRGVNVVPLLDFATCNDSWLGFYDRMVCSKPYDALVRDLIRDAYRIFASPDFIHIGFADEGRSKHPPRSYAVMRQGDLWMRYLVRTSAWVKETGAKAWAWFDYPWGMKDFLLDCPRDIVYSNLKPLSVKRNANRFSQVVKATCDVVPFIHSAADADVVAKLPSARILGSLKEVSI